MLTLLLPSSYGFHNAYDKDLKRTNEMTFSGMPFVASFTKIGVLISAMLMLAICQGTDSIQLAQDI
jgi:hypothetical protein